MHTITLIILYGLVTLGGLAGYAADTYLNVEHVRGTGSLWNGPVITTMVIAVMTMIAASCAGLAWAKKQRLISVMCFIGIAFSTVWSAPVSLSRMTLAIENHKSTIENQKRRAELLSNATSDLKDARKKETKRGGCGKNCRGIIDDQMSVLNKSLAITIPPDANKGMKDLAFVLGIEHDRLERAVPISAVLALMLLMNSLLAFGVSGLASVRLYKRRKRPTREHIKQRRYRRAKSTLPPDHPILREIARGEISVGELAQASGHSRPYVSSFTGAAERQGLVRRRKDGRNIMVSLVN